MIPIELECSRRNLPNIREGFGPLRNAGSSPLDESARHRQIVKFWDSTLACLFGKIWIRNSEF